jgi:two-component sensor histidine kinase
LGLLVTELITNALRHSYPEGSSGLVVVDAHRAGSDLLVTIQDDGQGVPPEAGGKELGPTIIGGMSAQIDAECSVAFEAGSGTLVTIRVPNFPQSPPAGD